MGILGFGKKKEATKGDCCCGGNCEASIMEPAKQEQGNELSVKVLGSGCTKCNQLEVSTREALDQLGMEIRIEHVTDFAQIAAYGVMTTPALVVNGKVVSFGKVLKTEEVVKILQAVI